MTSPFLQLAADTGLERLMGDFTPTAFSKVANCEYGWSGPDGRSRVNLRTYEATKTACYLADVPHKFTQGGLNNGAVSQSGGTHDLLDVCDLSVEGMSSSKQYELVRWLDECGACGMIRGTDKDNVSDSMDPHIHVVMYKAQFATKSCYDSVYSKSFGTKYGGAGLGGNPRARWYGPDLKHTDREWARSPYNWRNGWRP